MVWLNSWQDVYTIVCSGDLRSALRLTKWFTNSVKEPTALIASIPSWIISPLVTNHWRDYFSVHYCKITRSHIIWGTWLSWKCRTKFPTAENDMGKMTNLNIKLISGQHLNEIFTRTDIEGFFKTVCTHYGYNTLLQQQVDI